MKNDRTFGRLNAEGARGLLAREGVLVLDVRDAASYERGRIGPARRISEADVAALLSATPKKTPVLIYCYHGRASQVYAQMFADFGFHEVYSLDGGFEGWSRSNGDAPAVSDAASARHE